MSRIPPGTKCDRCDHAFSEHRGKPDAQGDGAFSCTRQRSVVIDATVEVPAHRGAAPCGCPGFREPVAA